MRPLLPSARASRKHPRRASHLPHSFDECVRVRVFAGLLFAVNQPAVDLDFENAAGPRNERDVERFARQLAKSGGQTGRPRLVVSHLTELDSDLVMVAHDHAKMRAARADVKRRESIPFPL
jgi:hypothetical protein